MVTALALGFGLAFVGSAPMTGPLALLVLDRVIVLQRASAFWIALAGALVEAFIAAAIGTFLPLVLRHSQTIVLLARVSGALVIFAVGVTLLIRPGVLDAIKTERKRQSFLAGFLATALNPTLLATWTVAVTALHANGLLAGGYRVGIAFGTGVGAGALAWFVLILLLARRWSPQRAAAYRGALARAVGVILILLGAIVLIRATLPSTP
jgi:threonine/homoserine/homoserine lactone efflux protein